MVQKYHPYWLWEDYKNQMYSTEKAHNEVEAIENCIMLLSSKDDFYFVCKSILNNWLISCDVNLSNRNQNRRAWLGAAACNYKYNAPEYVTRIAWSKLDYITQRDANLIAEQIIKQYERQNCAIHRNMEKQVLF